jgi:signal transduction histidine kinase
MGQLSNGAGPEVDAIGGGVAVAPGHRRSARTAHRIAWRHGIRTEPAVDHAELRVAAERQRIAGALHDDVSSALFAIAVGVQRAQALRTDDVDELRRTLARIGDQVLDASDRLREVLRSCTPTEPTEAVPVAAQRDLDDLTERSGIGAHLVVRGRPRALPSPTERATLNCLRQALFNIERHAAARTVIVTLDYGPDEIVLIVQDDGRGLPDGFEPRVVPEAGQHWGFASMARQVEQRGGELDLRDVEEGGTRLRVRLPA